MFSRISVVTQNVDLALCMETSGKLTEQTLTTRHGRHAWSSMPRLAFARLYQHKGTLAIVTDMLRDARNSFLTATHHKHIKTF